MRIIVLFKGLEMVKFFPVIFALLEQAFDALDTCFCKTVSLWVNFSSDVENKDNKGIKKLTKFCTLFYNYYPIKYTHTKKIKINVKIPGILPKFMKLHK